MSDYEKRVVLVWPQPSSGLLIGWQVAVLDADTGDMITTIMDMSIHVASADLVTVRATMFADPEGHPVFAGTGSAELHQDSDGDVITGVFDLLVAEMRIAGIPGSAWPDEARAVSA